MQTPLVLTSISALVTKSWNTYKDRFQLFFLISLLPNIPFMFVQLLQPASLREQSVLLYILIAVLALIGIYISLWSYGAMLMAIPSTEKKDWWSFYTKSQAKIWVILGSGLLTALAIFGGIILLIIPGIIFSIWFGFCTYFVVYENKKSVESLKASKALVKGYTFKVFIRIAVVMAVYGIAATLVGSIGESMGNAVLAILNAALGILATPFFAIYCYEIYTNLKAVKTENSPL